MEYVEVLKLWSTRLLTEFGYENPVVRKKIKPIENNGGEKMKKKVEKSLKLDDGKYTGKIKDIEYKTSPYEYVDIVITEDVQKLDIKCGVPFHITSNSALGKILENFGAELKEDEELEIEDFLKKGVAVGFSVINEETKKGVFARIQPYTLKPIK